MASDAPATNGGPRASRVIAGVAVGIVGWWLFALVASSFGAAPIFDDAWGIIQHWPAPLGAMLVKEWTQPSYLAQGVEFPEQFAWGPLAVCLQDLVGALAGRDAITPFRLLNVGVFAATLVGVAGATSTISGSRPAALVTAAALAVHPVAADVVPWSADLFDALGAMFVAVGTWACLRAESDRAFVAAAAAAFTLALFSKPTVIALAPLFPLLALLGRDADRRGALGRAGWTAVAIASCGIAHNAAYTHVAPWPLGRTLVGRLGSGDAASWTTLTVAWGSALLDGVAPRGAPALFRFVVPALAMGRVIGGVVAALVAAGGCWALRDRSWARAGGVALLAWCLALVPGALFATWKGMSALRYSYLPLVAVAPLAASAVLGLGDELLRGRRLGSGAVQLLRGACALAGLLVIGSWLQASTARVAAYRSMGELLSAELSDPDYLSREAHGSVLEVQAAKYTWFDHVTLLRATPDADALRGAHTVCAEGSRYADAIAGMESNPAFTREEQVGTLFNAVGLNRDMLTPATCGGADYAALTARLAALGAAAPR